MCKRNSLKYSICGHTLPDAHKPFTRCSDAPPRFRLCRPVTNKVRTGHGFCHKCYLRMVGVLERLKRAQEMGWEWELREKGEGKEEGEGDGEGVSEGEFEEEEEGYEGEEEGEEGEEEEEEDEEE